MGRLVIGMAAGALIAVAAMVPAAYKFRHDQREKGRIEGKMEAVLALEEHFGIYKDTDTDAYERVFDVNCASVLAINVNNVKTVRTTRPGDDAAMRAKQARAAQQGSAK